MNKYYKIIFGKKVNILLGFSLPEIMVAVSLFAFVGLISSSIILTLNVNNQLIISKKKVYDAVDLAMDDMSREIREGGEYYASTSSNPTASFIRFIPKFATTTCIEYSATTSSKVLTSNKILNILNASNTKIIKTMYSTSSLDIDIKTVCRIESNGADIKERYDITSPDINITRFYTDSRFGTNTGTSSDEYLPIASIIVEGYSNVNPNARFRLERSISRRYSE
ncbi:MAG: hypothetical protein QM532_02965 [Cyanobium sp. MAG06]|nr:hypothetical protein [Cyanobium sp. MAG06]